MIFRESRLLADDSHENHILVFTKIRKDVAKFVVCCCGDWRFKGYLSFACREIFHYIWKKLTMKDRHEWKLTTVDPQERSTWRSGVRSAMRAASQFTWKGAH